MNSIGKSPNSAASLAASRTVSLVGSRSGAAGKSSILWCKARNWLSNSRAEMWVTTRREAGWGPACGFVIRCCRCQTGALPTRGRQGPAIRGIRSNDLATRKPLGTSEILLAMELKTGCYSTRLAERATFDSSRNEPPRKTRRLGSSTSSSRHHSHTFPCTSWRPQAFGNF